MSLNGWQQIATILFVFLNIRSFYLFYSDKKRSERKKYRISEKKLLLSAALLGGVGAWIGSILFRHKTKKKVFRYTLPSCFSFTLFLYLFILLQ